VRLGHRVAGCLGEGEVREETSHRRWRAAVDRVPRVRGAARSPAGPTLRPWASCVLAARLTLRLCCCSISRSSASGSVPAVPNFGGCSLASRLEARRPLPKPLVVLLKRGESSPLALRLDPAVVPVKHGFDGSFF